MMKALYLCSVLAVGLLAAFAVILLLRKKTRSKTVMGVIAIIAFLLGAYASFYLLSPLFYSIFAG